MSELPPRAEVIDALRFAVAPAAAAAAGVAILGGLVASRLIPRWRQSMPAVSVLALAAAVAVGNHFRGPLPWVPDAAWWHWAGPAIALVFATEFVCRLGWVSGEVGHLLRGLTAGIAAAAFTPPDWQAEARWTFPLLAAVIAAEWGVLVAVGRQAGGGKTALAVAVVAGGAAIVLLHHNVLRFVDVATLIQVGLAVLAVLAWLTRADASAAAAAAVAPLLGVLVLGRFLSESEVRWGSFLAVGLAPLALAVLLLPGVRRWNGRWPGVVLALLLVAAPVGWGAATAVSDAPLKFDLSEKTGE